MDKYDVMDAGIRAESESRAATGDYGAWIEVVTGKALRAATREEAETHGRLLARTLDPDAETVVDGKPCVLR